jgi:hypothetical protein
VVDELSPHCVVSGNGRGYPEEKVYSPGAPRSWSGRRQSSNGGPSCKSAANVELKGKARQLEMVQFDRTLTSILNSRFYLKEHPCRVQRGVRVFYPKRRQHCTVGRSTSTEENARERPVFLQTRVCSLVQASSDRCAFSSPWVCATARPGYASGRRRTRRTPAVVAS